MAQKSTIPKEEVTQSIFGHQRLLGLIKCYAPREKGQAWQIIKFHIVLHITSNIQDFGVPLNIDTSAPEHNHIQNAKNPCKRTQKYATSIEIQIARIYYENMVINHATRELQSLIPNVLKSSGKNTSHV